MKRLTLVSIVSGTAMVASAAPALAYVGPGAGISLIGALIGLVSAVFLALFAVLRWPIRRYLARRRSAGNGETAPPRDIDTGTK